MTREETRKAIEVMQAYVDGKEIECEWIGKGYWEDWPNPAWNWFKYSYRIKPQPKEIWVNEYRFYHSGHDSAYDATGAAGDSAIRVAVHYREVTGDK